MTDIKTGRKIRALIIKDKYIKKNDAMKKMGVKLKDRIKSLNKWASRNMEENKECFRETGDVEYMHDVITYIKLYKPRTFAEYEAKLSSKMSALAVIQAMRYA